MTPDIRYAWRVCAVASIGLVLIGVAGSTLNVALPAVVRHFKAGPLESSWILLSYLLVMTASMVFFGRVADLWGRRETYLAGFALFTIASLLAGFSPNVWFLIAMRMLQAAAAAMILANGAVIITHAFPPEKLSRGMGVYIGTLSVAQLTGPTLGGFIADTAGWQWIFWINVVPGIASVTLGALILRKVPRGPKQPIDGLGNALIFAALSALLLALSETGSVLITYGGAIVFVVLVPLIWLVERRASHPVFDTRLFAGRLLVLGNFASFCNAVSRSALLLLAALYFQVARGVDALTAGVSVLPLAVGMAVASPIAGLLRVSPYAVTVGGAVFSSAGLGLLMANIDPATPYWVLAVGLFVAGCGSGTFLTGNTTQMMSALPADSLGVVNGLRLMIMNVGLVLSVGLSLTLLTSSVPPAVRDQVYAATLAQLSPVAVGQLMDGFRLTYAVLFCVSLLGALSAALARGPRRRPGSPVWPTTASSTRS
ncbi:MFS transporter [Nonomuraea soli]|uniref:EmrB/QacA subfamily drug resistance transporter n=1 Tax=Nonomuraea soli TaxID=1032476 RepID=A0A7W0CUS0_9ACTN|nr:MFS transporter [Nonomuraea soli]MBA2897558.1 EmrB/QacA subfamily drug resistance transporter [Nonomuraea soli]